MDEHALTIMTICDGPVCTLTLSGDLDFAEASGFLQHAALTIDNQTERLVLDLAGVAFLDCAGARALTIAMRFVPSGCPVIVRSLSPMARRILALLGLNLEQSGNSARVRNLKRSRGMGQLARRNLPRRSRATWT